MSGESWDRASANELRLAFEELGPTYVKLGQMIASSPGMFPDVLAEECRACLDEVPPVSYEGVRQVFEEEFGGPIEDFFSAFDPTPLASASIGQAHVATLHEGDEVVVKVQRPGIHERLEGDLRIIMRIARILERSPRLRTIGPVAAVEDFAISLAEELNFQIAARAMERFERNLRSFGHHLDVRTPKVHWRYTTDRVLVMERIHGYNFDNLPRDAGSQWDLPGALKKGVRAWMESVLQHGFFHGDVHGGNLMLDPQGDVVMLDFGIVGRLDQNTKEVLRQCLPALMFQKDYKTVASAMFGLGSGIKPEHLDAAAADIGTILEPILSRPLAEISYGEILVDIIRVGSRYEARVPRQLVLVAKQLLYFERYAKEMAPGWSILADPEIVSFLATPSAGGPPTT